MKATDYILRPRIYRGSETPPSALEDISRFGNDGAFAVGAAWIRLESGLWVLDFTETGGTDFVNCGNDNSLHLTDFSGYMWAYFTSSGANGFMSKSTTAYTDGWSFFVNTDQKLYFRAYAPTTQSISTDTLSLNTWVFLAFVKVGLDVDLYINGLANGGNALNNEISSPENNNLTLGRFASNSTVNDLHGYLGLPMGLVTAPLSADFIYSVYQATRKDYNV